MTPDTSRDEQHAALRVRPSANEPAALLTQLLTAVRELTIVPVPGADVQARGACALFYPLVGLVLGGMLVVVDAWLPAALPAGVRALVLVALLLVLTGARHLRGVARALTSVGAEDGETVPARGVGLAAMLVLAQVVLITELSGGVRLAALLFAPVLARWSMVAFAFGSRTQPGAAADDRALRDMTFREFAGASVLALGVTLTYAEVWGLVVILALGLGTIGGRVLAHGMWGGITRPLVDTVGVCNETLALAVFWLAAV